MPTFSEETQQLLDRAQLAIDHAVELRAARLRAIENRKRILIHMLVRSHQIDAKAVSSIRTE